MTSTQTTGPTRGDDDRPSPYWAFDDRRPLDCRTCGWSGPPDVASQTSFLDVRCARCDGPLLKFSWPTVEETRAAAAAGNVRAQRELVRVEEVEARWAEAARSELRHPEQLPALDGDRIAIAWDFEQVHGESWTVLRHDGRELFRELAFWEGTERFEEVVIVLQCAYGRRLVAVEPTAESELFLYGDRLGAPRTVTKINARLARGPRDGRFGDGWAEAAGGA